MTAMPPQLGDPGFFEDAQGVIHGVRRALADLLAEVGADASQPQEVSRTYGIDKTLAWKVCRVIREPVPWDAVGHIPRKPSVQILVRALAKHGATDDVIGRLWDAVDEFEKFVGRHSDDRETLEIMIGSSAKGAGAGKRLEAFRRTAYQANSAIWGVRTKLHVCMHILAPTPGTDDLSTATISGFHGFNRLRPDVPWNVATISNWDVGELTNETKPDAIIPIDPAVAAEGGGGSGGGGGEGGTDAAPILREFCSEPLPSLRNVRLPDGRTRFELNRGSVGNTAAATMLLGWVSRHCVSRFERYPGELGEHGLFLSTPAETVVHDLLVHKSLTFAHTPSMHVFSELPGGPRYLTDGAAAGTIPIHEHIVELGSPPDLTTTEFPRYRDLATRGTEALGIPLSEFVGFRMRLEYPPIPTLAIIRHALAKKEA